MAILRRFLHRNSVGICLPHPIYISNQSRSHHFHPRDASQMTIDPEIWQTCEIMQSSKNSCNNATFQCAAAPSYWNPQAVTQFPEKKWIVTQTVGNLSAFTVSLKEYDHLYTDMKLYTILQLVVSVKHTKGKYWYGTNLIRKTNLIHKMY